MMVTISRFPLHCKGWLESVRPAVVTWLRKLVKAQDTRQNIKSVWLKDIELYGYAMKAMLL